MILHHRRFLQAAEGGHPSGMASERHRHQVCAVHDLLFPDDHRFQLLLRHHPVQPRGDLQQPEEERRLHSRLPSGNPTAAFIQKVLNKVTLFGAVYLGIVAILPLIIGKIVNVAALSIGGTSVIIVVGVALETVQALESQMLMRQYKGFLE